MVKEIVKAQYEEHKKVVEENSQFVDEVTKATEIIIKALKDKKRLYACGNGGSSCDAMHLVEEMVGRYKNNRPPLAAHNLMDPSTLTCISNDFGYDDVFSRPLDAYGQEGDIFVGITTSGNSPNVIKAFDVAKKKGMKTILLLGKDGGKLKDKADAEILIKSEMTARIQEMHILAIHTFMECIDKEIFGV